MKLIARLVVLAALMSSWPVAAGQTPHVSGTITYRERMALPPTAVVDVRLDDVTSAGGVPPVVAAMRIEHPGQVPIKFDLSYDARAIDARGRYAVRATISDGGVVLFASLDTPLVLTQGHGPRADLVLTKVAPEQPATAPAAKAATAPPWNPLTDLPATFTGTLPCADCEGIRYQLNLFADDSFFAHMTYAGKASAAAVDDLGSWALSSDRRVLILKGRTTVEMFAIPTANTLKKLDADGQPLAGRVPGELTRGGFKPIAVKAPMRGVVPAADSAVFVECSTGQRWPVAGEGAAADLASAYAKARPAAGVAVVAELEATATPRPARSGSGTETMLVVDKVVRLLPRESCAPRFASAPLTDTYWRLTRLGDRAIPAVTDVRREPSLTFQAAIGSAPGGFSGSNGCNRMIGSYVIADASLTLTPGGTLMACKEDAATEAALVAALKATRTYRISGRTLELFDAKGARLARFEAKAAAGITVR